MEVKDNIMLLWPTPIGVFYNDNHYAIKNNLIDFFENYKNKIPIQKKEMKILIFMKVITIFINLIIHHMKN